MASERVIARLLLALLLAALPGDVRGADRESEMRHLMVEQQIRERGVTDTRVLAAMEKVPRHLFVPAPQRAAAYKDTPLPIGQGQTISQPYMVARMTELLGIGPGDKVLEIGTGSGYQSAVLSEIVGPNGQVYSVEIIAPLGAQARSTLGEQGYRNVQVRIGDGYKGWPEHAPFDAIIVTAAPPDVPEPLLSQVKPGGRLVLPVGEVWQDLQVLTKRADGTFDRQKVLPVRFVPMTGEAQHVHR
ncbi:MAG TPA: protein-L-isoaspartate(D-aspartate) O-methyltransferase [Thermoanaerobaculia bacterium]|nr:protein-L-isoaspartate(D-aspartate) O-methyltransferase [Thermoanaerobaculia bacterium]